MRMLAFVAWSLGCIGLGIAAGTLDVAGKTPWEHAQAAWKTSSPQVERAKTEAGALVETMKKKVAERGPAEQHSPSDRQSLDRLIAKQQDR